MDWIYCIKVNIKSVLLSLTDPTRDYISFVVCSAIVDFLYFCRTISYVHQRLTLTFTLCLQYSSPLTLCKYSSPYLFFKHWYNIAGSLNYNFMKAPPSAALLGSIVLITAGCLIAGAGDLQFDAFAYTIGGLSCFAQVNGNINY